MRRPLILAAAVAIALALSGGANGAVTRRERVDGIALRPTGAVFPCTEPKYESKPPTWATEMPTPKETSVTKAEVQIPSEDGTLISARVYLPDAYEGRKLPTILVMSPYHSILGIYFKELEDADVFEYADCITPFFLQRGYAVVLADMRGTHNSDGCFDFGGPGDQQDGYATVEWIAEQEWSNGKVGMYGVSHVGMSQYAAAVKSPPALKAIIPIAPITSFYRYLYNHGVHYETNMLTPAAYEYAVAAPPPTNAGAPNYPKNLADTACNSQAVVKGMSLEGTMDEYWKKRDYPSMAKKIKAAVFHVHGTLDENVKTDHFAAIWQTLQARDVARKALIGPWGHSEPDVDYWHLIALRWYEHWLNDNDTGMMDEPAVTLIDQEEKTRTVESWPPAPASRSVLHAGDGKLAPQVAGGSASYQDIPQFPRALLRQADGVRLLYSGSPLKKPLRVSGTPAFEVVATIDRQDTNFAVHLFDVDKDGEAHYVTRGYLDARHRNGVEKSEPVEPGKEYRYAVALHPREYVFDKGHSVQVLLASSDSCQWLISSQLTRAVECRSSGVVSDTTAAKVTVAEGKGLTRLLLPTAPLGR